MQSVVLSASTPIFNNDKALARVFHSNPRKRVSLLQFSPQSLPFLFAQQAELTFHGWIAIFVTVAIFGAMQRRRTASVDLLFLGGLVLVTLTGVLTPEQALDGFSNKAVVMIAALFATTAGLRATGALDWIGNRLLGGATTERGALGRGGRACLGICPQYALGCDACAGGGRLVPSAQHFTLQAVDSPELPHHYRRRLHADRDQHYARDQWQTGGNGSQRGIFGGNHCMH